MAAVHIREREAYDCTQPEAALCAVSDFIGKKQNPRWSSASHHLSAMNFVFRCPGRDHFCEPTHEIKGLQLEAFSE